MLREVQSAALTLGDQPFDGTNDPSLTPAQKRGLKYQAKVEKRLEALYPGRLLLRPWFRYKQDWKTKLCQPDVVLMAPDWSRCSVLEIKYSTIPEAWKKLSEVYVPVLQKAYRIPVTPIFVTRMFDPHIGWTVKITQLEGLERLGEWHEEGLGVVSWK